MDTDNRTAARGLIDVKAYLYRQAHLGAARRRLAEFTARAADFSPGRKPDPERFHLDGQPDVARTVADHIVDGIRASEQMQRIRSGRWLRGTLMAMELIGVVLFVGAALVVFLAV
ncbi:hypothetical protein ACFV5G_14400 [Streptomyces sp. NPDC059766]|uniref:hypothetical protein n=1 Tax=Streptomyces sp. NPDC059766 TaxID=3346940 RepID=UPI003666AA5B